MDIETQHEYKVGDRFTAVPGTTWAELEGVEFTVSRLDDDGDIWAETDLVPPMRQVCFDPTLITPVPLADFDVVDLARAALSELWCELDDDVEAVMERLVALIPDLVARIDALQEAVDNAAERHCGCLGGTLDEAR